MSSRAMEARHKEKLEDILKRAGLVCERPYVESDESSEESKDSIESEKPSLIEPHEEFVEEEGYYYHESISATTPDEQLEGPAYPIFPTPSLALYRDERAKRIHDQNAIHVLPDEFNKEIDATKIPRIGKHPHEYIATLGQLVGCTRFAWCLAEYWFLDTLAHLLSRAQADHLPPQTQVILVHWFCEWMQEMRHFDVADRRRMMNRFKEVMQLAAQFIEKEERLPTPREIGVDFKEVWSYEVHSQHPIPTTKSSATRGSKINAKFDSTRFECCMRDLAAIIHYIYDLFNTDYQYNLIRSIFTFRPEYQLIDASFQLRVPKKAYTAPKPPPEPVQSPESSKTAKSSRKNPDPKIVEPPLPTTEEDTPEYLHLMEIKQADEEAVQLQIMQDKEDWNKRNSILPLAMALDENFLDKYWPPPPSSEILEVVEPKVSETKKKSTKSGKK